MNPRSWKIRTRLVLAFVGVLGPYLALAGLAAYALPGLLEGIRVARDEAVMAVKVPADLQLAVAELVMPANDYLITGDPGERKAFEERLARVHQLLASVEAFHHHNAGEQEQLLATVKRQVSKMEAVSRQILAIAEPKTDTAAAGKMKALDRLGEDAAVTLGRSHEIGLREIEEEIDRGSAVIRRVTTGGLIAILLSVAGGLVLAFFFSSWLARPMLAIARGARRMAEGDLSHRVDAAAGGELGETARAFNAMAERLEASSAERSRLFEEAEAERNRLAAVMRSAKDAIILADQAGNILSWNKAAEEIFGYREEEVQGQPLSILMPPRYRSAHREGIERLRTTGVAGMFGKTVELHGQRKDGSEFPLELSLASWTARDELFFSGIIRDVGERKRAEEALRQREKFEAMSAMLNGVAHELNNPLAIVTAHTFLLRETSTSDPVKERATKIAEAAERCAQIVRTFITLARQGPLERGPVALNQVARNAVALLETRLTLDRIDVVLDLADDLPLITGDAMELGEVVVNLLTNAEQSMRESLLPRRLTLTSRAHPERRTVSLEVTDTGPGVPREIRSRIFDPLFSTKPPGEGTGLGLSLAQRVVEAHEGTIRLVASSGESARFRVELPIEGPPPAAVREIALPRSVERPAADRGSIPDRRERADR